MSRKDDLFTAQNQRILELEAELKQEKLINRHYRDMIGEMMAEQAVARAKEVGTWEG